MADKEQVTNDDKKPSKEDTKRMEDRAARTDPSKSFQGTGQEVRK